MKINKKIIAIILSIICFFTILFSIHLSKKVEIKSQEQNDSYEKQQIELEKKISDKDLEATKKYSCAEQANVWWTECIIEKLDQASAEREWKQRKLENLKDSEINIGNLVPVLGDEQAKIRKWRLGFESGRNAWCEAQSAFVAGSGTPGGIANCELEIELKAIHNLNFLYYDSVVNFNESKGILDFEPTEKDIDNLVKTNKTVKMKLWQQ